MAAASLRTNVEILKLLVVAPEIVPPSVKAVAPLYHWYVKPEPVAATLNVAVSPVHKVCVAIGCDVRVTFSITSNSAFVEVAVGEQFPLTIQL